MDYKKVRGRLLASVQVRTYRTAALRLSCGSRGSALRLVVCGLCFVGHVVESFDISLKIFECWEGDEVEFATYDEICGECLYIQCMSLSPASPRESWFSFADLRWCNFSRWANDSDDDMR